MLSWTSERQIFKYNIKGKYNLRDIISKTITQEGSLGGAVVWRLPLAQGVILETQDRIPHQGPGAWSLLLPSAYASASLCVSLYLS